MNLYGIVVAAGAGERFGRPKAHVMLRGMPLWQWARDALVPFVSDVIVVGDVSGGVPGGSRRRDSVASGLGALPQDATHVLIHDAARPLASAALVGTVVARLRQGGVEAVVPAVAVTDTVKRVVDGMVVETVDRSSLAIVQTPQGFELGALRAAHGADDADASDDALLVERNGGTVAVVDGDPANLKVTAPEDLAVVEALLS